MTYLAWIKCDNGSEDYRLVIADSEEDAEKKVKEYYEKYYVRNITQISILETIK